MNNIYILILLLFSISLNSYGQDGYLTAKRRKSYSSSINNTPTISHNLKNDKSIVEIDLSSCKYHKKEFKEDGNWMFLQLKGFPYIHQAGAPAIPTKQFIYEVEGEYDLEVKEGSYVTHNNILVHPVKEDDIDTEGVPNKPYYINKEIYATDAFFPKHSVEIQNVQKASGRTYVTVRISPIQYNPVTKELRIFSHLSYTLKGVKNPNHSKKRKVSNINDQPDNYLIVTVDKYKEAAEELAKWKALQGFNVEIESRQSWEAADVKKVIHDKYNTLPSHLQYFLIMGDHEDVPGELYKKTYAGNVTEYASDLYYSCMDGEDDYTADIAHGRISCRSYQEATTIVNKIIKYEKTPINNPNFYRTALCCAQFQDVADSEAPDGEAARRFCQTSEEVRDYLTGEQNYFVNRVYYTDPGNTPMKWNNGSFGDGSLIPEELRRKNGFNWDGDAADIKREIEDGRFFILHRDHGYMGGSGWAHPRFVSRDVDNLENGDLLPVVFSMNCYTGEFKLPECFAEKFVKNPKGGAVGVIAASNFSYSGYNDALTAGMIDALWSDPGLTPQIGHFVGNGEKPGHIDGVERMGDVLNQGLLRMQETYYSGGQSDIYTHRLFHYFGDPTMKMWTQQPSAIRVDIPEQVNMDSRTLTINNIENTTLTFTLVQNGEIISFKKKEANSNQVTLEFNNISPEYPLYIGVFGTNKIPTVKELFIQGNNHKPIADFIYSRSSDSYQDDNNPITFIFSNKSTYIPKSYRWTFTPNNVKYIDETSETSTNPKVQFLESGTYEVSLTATNDNGNDTKTLASPIHIESVKACCLPTLGNNYNKILNFNISNLDIASTNKGWEDDPYNSNISQGVAILKKGERTPFTIDVDARSSNYSIHIDLNNDGQFSEDEQIFETTDRQGVVGSTVQGEITIPNNIAKDKCNIPLRLRISQYTAWSKTGPCEKRDWGQTQDYGIVIRDGQATPVIESISNTPEKVTINCNIRNGYDIESKGIIYSEREDFLNSHRLDNDTQTNQYQEVLTNLKEVTNYYFKSYCIIGGETAFSDIKQITTYYHAPLNNPNNFRGIAIDPTTIRLKWDSPNQVCQKLWVIASNKSFDVLNNPSAGSKKEDYEICKIIDGNQKKIDITNLNPNSTYYFKIVACNNDGINQRFCKNDIPQTKSITPEQSDYPLALYAHGNSNMIERVVFNTINNAGLRDDKGGNFHKFSDISTAIERGNSYKLELQVEAPNNNKYFAKAWIDWNQNKELETSECYLLKDDNSKIYAFDIEVPAYAETGNTTLRIVYASSNYEGTITSHGINTTEFGMVEEYSLEVLDGLTSTSIKDGIRKMGAMAYPNPVVHEMILTIKIDICDDAAYSIYDNNGRCIMNSKITDQTTKINMDVATGVYTLVLKNNGETGIKKIIVQ